MSAHIEYINNYPDVDRSSIQMIWNGKRGSAFDDRHQGFREKVILNILNNMEEAPIPLIYDLMHEEACWAGKTLTFRYYLPVLLEWLLKNDLEGCGEKIARTFKENHFALKSFEDLESKDGDVEEWIRAFEKMEEYDRDHGKVYEPVIQALKHLLATRHGEREKKAAFEAYVAHRDPLPVAVVNHLKWLWKHGEVTWLSLFFILPLTLLLGYYYFGFSILYGMLPMFRAMLLIYIIYKGISWIIR